MVWTTKQVVCLPGEGVHDSDGIPCRGNEGFVDVRILDPRLRLGCSCVTIKSVANTFLVLLMISVCSLVHQSQWQTSASGCGRRRSRESNHQHENIGYDFSLPNILAFQPDKLRELGVREALNRYIERSARCCRYSVRSFESRVFCAPGAYSCLILSASSLFCSSSSERRRLNTRVVARLISPPQLRKACLASSAPGLFVLPSPPPKPTA